MAKNKITIELISSSTTEEIFTVLCMLNPGTEFTVSCASVKSVKGKRGPYKKRTSTTPLSKAHHDRPVQYEDNRIVWDHKRNRINVQASCKEMGVTLANLISTPCQRGSVAFTVKQSYIRRQRSDARAQNTPYRSGTAQAVSGLHHHLRTLL